MSTVLYMLPHVEEFFEGVEGYKQWISKNGLKTEIVPSIGDIISIDIIVGEDSYHHFPIKEKLYLRVISRVYNLTEQIWEVRIQVVADLTKVAKEKVYEYVTSWPLYRS